MKMLTKEDNHARRLSSSVVPREDYLAMAQLNSPCRNEQYLSADSFSSSSTRKRPMSSFRIGSFGDALNSSEKKTVFMFVIMHFHDHSTRKSSFQCILIILFERSYYPNDMIACGSCSIWQPRFVRHYSLVASGIIPTNMGQDG